AFRASSADGKQDGLPAIDALGIGVGQLTLAEVEPGQLFRCAGARGGHLPQGALAYECDPIVGTPTAASLKTDGGTQRLDETICQGNAFENAVVDDDADRATVW